MADRESTGRRSTRESRRPRSRDRHNNEKSTSPVASPGSWNVDRGRSRVRRPSNPFSEETLRRRGYHSLQSSFGKVFHVEKRWKLVREMGSGAYGVVISAADEISGETVAIKLVTRVFDKVQLAKRALREITLLRHFSGHENITGLIDVDAISPDFNEIYIFMEPMEADLHQIIKSGQVLTNEHVQYFLYQILRGMKYLHSACVIHRDLKPGNLLVNADCELKICDFGLSRGFECGPDETASHLTEYVATRWYRAPEIMLAFRGYSTEIDVWSIGCILAELLLSKPLFKGKDYVDQLNKILDVLGSPGENIVKRIGSDKAQAYVRSLPFKKPVPFRKVLSTADTQAVDLLTKMLTFDPRTRINVLDALEHPWLSSYHDATDEPSCLHKFEKWRMIEKLETLDEFREALWNEIEDYRREVRGMNLNIAYSGILMQSSILEADEQQLLSSDGTDGEKQPSSSMESPAKQDKIPEFTDEIGTMVQTTSPATDANATSSIILTPPDSNIASSSVTWEYFDKPTPTDPVVTYARRSSILQPSRVGSAYASPQPTNQTLPFFPDGPLVGEPGSMPGSNLVTFPSNGHGSGFVIPARSRTGSIAGGDVTRKLLRTLSTVSIHESVEGLPNGLAGIAPIGKYIVQKQATEADAPPSEMPKDFLIEADDEVRAEERGGKLGSSHDGEKGIPIRRGKFHLDST